MQKFYKNNFDSLRFKKDLTILLGNAVDHFDISLYIFMVPIIAPIFFPNENPTIELIMGYSVLATSAVTRPLGVYFFGNIARKFGAPYALSLSLIGVGIGTALISILPGYDMIGVLSPLLLLLMRIFRGIFASGEGAIAKLYIVDDKEHKKAFKGSYLYQISSIIGIIFASWAATIASYVESDYIWRVFFILGGFAAIIGYLMRKNLFKIDEINTSYLIKPNLMENIRIILRNRAIILRIAIANSFSHLTYIIPFVTMNYIVPLISNIQPEEMMVLSSVTLMFDAIFIPIAGAYLTRFSAENIMFSASFILGITIMPLWYFIDNSSIIYISFVRFWVVVWGVIFLCPLNLWCNKQIIGNDKYLVVGMGASLGDLTIGKLTPSICLLIYYYTDSHFPLSIYFSALFIITAYFVRSCQTSKIIN